MNSGSSPSTAPERQQSRPEHEAHQHEGSAADRREPDHGQAFREGAWASSADRRPQLNAELDPRTRERRLDCPAPMAIRIDGSRFVDEHGRTLILRGVNLGGSSKVPARPDGATHRREGFFEHRDVSFVGRPFPLEEADEHFARLRAWGLTFLRLLVTWEAIEHAGPGRYDEAYLDYVRAIVERAGRHGFDLFIDPHQDMWSRFSGGDGAPGWTLEAVGFDLAKLAATGAAVVHALHEGPFPRMIWPSNETKLAAATMFTLFFGGNDFAPATRIEGEPAQDYLQRHYIAAICQLARRLEGLPCVVGYDTLNEPLRGYLGWPDLRVAGGMVTGGGLPDALPGDAARRGPSAGGRPLERGTRPDSANRGPQILNPERARAWLPGFDCLWRRNGVWDVDGDGTPRLLRPDHFARRDGRPVDFSQDHYLPFARRFAEAIRAVQPGAAIFVESAPQQPPPRWKDPGLVHAPHWYDGFVLFLKRYSDWVAVDSRTPQARLHALADPALVRGPARGRSATRPPSWAARRRCSASSGSPSISRAGGPSATATFATR